MRDRPQWINWRAEHRAGESKPAKVPCDVATGERINPHDPSRWMPYDLARALDPEHVGFVLTVADPYFCIDLDHAWDGAAWSTLALDVCARFPGAYVEVSYSGDGLHVIGRGAPPDGYSTRGDGVECYTHDRFIAITSAHAQGDPDTAHDLTAFAALYLKPGSAPGGDDAWTDKPVPEATPIEDDAALVRRMVTARASAAVAFGGKASAKDLWEGNVTVLADVWPHPTDDYDRSSTDAALASHLAFWTGRDCPRIERLMRSSALLRPKWDRGDNYLRRTIAGAAARCSKVYTGGTPQPAVEASWQYLTTEAQQDYFAGCCYVISAHKVLTPDGTTLSPERFNATYGHKEFQVTPDSQGRPEKKAFTAFTESRAHRFPKAWAMCFRPELEPGTIVQEDGLTLVNSYVSAPVPMGTGDVAPFLGLLEKLFPNDSDRAIVLAYLAALRQYPGRKFRWCPLIQGVEGNCKGVLTSVAEYAVSKRYTHKPNAKEIGDGGAKFNGWLDRKLLIIIEEIYVSDRREVLDALKPLITDDRVEIQHKGADQVTGENRANFILTSNHRDAITKTQNDRRYAIFYTAQQTRADLARDGMDGDYAPDLWAWLRGAYADVAGYLNRYQIPDAINPATHCHRAPETSTTNEAIRESRGLIEQSIMEAVEEGRPGFAGGWISSVALGRLLADLHRTVPPRKRADLLDTLGYVHHPALLDGRAPLPILQEDGKRPKIYVLKDSINYYNLTDPSVILHNYIKAQGWGSINYEARL